MNDRNTGLVLFLVQNRIFVKIIKILYNNNVIKLATETDSSEYDLPIDCRVDHIEGSNQRPFEQLDPYEAAELAVDFHDNAQTIDTGSGELVINDVSPEVQTGKPIVFVAGYYAEGSSMRQSMYDMVLSGRRTLTFSGYHGIDLTPEFRQKYEPKILELQRADLSSSILPQLRKAAALIAMLDEKGLKNVDVFAHSEGCIVTSIAAYLRPDLFAKKAMLCPAGSVGEKSVGAIKMRKGIDDAVAIQRRVENSIADTSYAIQTACRSVLSGVGLQSGERDETRTAWRQIDPRYASDAQQRRSMIQQDLSPKQRADANRSWLRWMQIQKGYAGGIPFSGLYGREYNRDADKGHLKSELNSLVRRRLEKWMPMIGADSVVVGACSRDALYPPGEVFEQMAQGGVSQFIEVGDATHNVQHYQPGKVTQFIAESLDVQVPKDGVHYRSQTPDKMVA